MNRARWGKLLGVAGVAGVAASGVLVARSQRQRGAYTPEEVRARLHARLASTSAGRPDHEPTGSVAPPAAAVASGGTGTVRSARPTLPRRRCRRPRRSGRG